MSLSEWQLISSSQTASKPAKPVQTRVFGQDQIWPDIIKAEQTKLEERSNQDQSEESCL